MPARTDLSVTVKLPPDAVDRLDKLVMVRSLRTRTRLTRAGVVRGLVLSLLESAAPELDAAGPLFSSEEPAK